LRPDSQLFEMNTRAFVRVAPAVLQACEAALRDARVEPGDAIALGRNRCPGALVFPSSTEPAPHARCPRERVYVAAIGLPRAGTARLAPGEVYDYSARAATEGLWAVRVVATIVGPSGSSLTYYDYVVRRDDPGWTFIKSVPLLTEE
jgi:hypothetical protein